MRLFAALAPPPDARAHLVAAAEQARRIQPQLRWVDEARLHLTLSFFGEVDPNVLPALGERLARAARRYPPLELTFAGGGRFDGRVLWVGVRGDREPLGRLADSVSAAARRCGLTVEDRRYRPHLTVARARTPVDLRLVVAELERYEGPSWRADRVHLVRSVLGPSPQYDDVETWALEAEPE